MVRLCPARAVSVAAACSLHWRSAVSVRALSEELCPRCAAACPPERSAPPAAAAPACGRIAVTFYVRSRALYNQHGFAAAAGRPRAALYKWIFSKYSVHFSRRCVGGGRGGSSAVKRLALSTGRSGLVCLVSPESVSTATVGLHRIDAG